MIVPIEKIIIKRRIRKDLGDIRELADDIAKNGLINPPAISKNYELIAGERRITACKSLGWRQIEVHQMDVDNAEKQLYMEIAENEARKGFTMTERLDYAKQIARIESAKHQQGKRNDLTSDKILSEVRANEIAAEKSGIGNRETLRQAQVIADNKDLISVRDFADWDEGRLSTNKLFRQVKERLAEAQEENSLLKERLQQAQEVREVVKEVIREVPPADYEDMKRYQEDVRRDYQISRDAAEKARAENEKLRQEIEELKGREGSELTPEQAARQLSDNAIFFQARVSNFLKDTGGYVYIADRLNEIDGRSRERYVSAVRALHNWTEELINRIENVVEVN